MWVSIEAAENEREKAGAAITLIFKFNFGCAGSSLLRPGFL